jgi:hypothetical protein
MDTLSIATYSKTGARGSVLDAGDLSLNVAAGKFTPPHVTLGPVVTAPGYRGEGSLRYAVEHAQSGETIWFLLPRDATVSLRKELVLPSPVTIAGPGVTVDGKSYRGLTLTNPNGRIFVVVPGAGVTVSGLIFAGGLASSSARVRAFAVHFGQRRQPKTDSSCGAGTFGGAILNAGTLVVEGSLFDSNRSPGICGGIGYGGAIFNDVPGRLTVTGTTFTGNRAGVGGAVYNGGTATFYDDTFAGNRGCTVVETACAVSGCTGYGCATFPYGFGAAIVDAGGPGVTIVRSTFEDNVAGGNFSGSIGAGGALYLATGDPAIFGSTFENNVAGGGPDNCSVGGGGAIFEKLQASGKLTLRDDRFVHNAAGGDSGGYGGAVYDQNAAVRGGGNTFEKNTAFGTGGTCQLDASAAGGALYANGGALLESSRFAGNFATADETAVGGAVYADAATTLDGDTFSGNDAMATGHGDPTAAPSAGGGAVFADNNAPLTLANASFESNGVSLAGAGGYYAYGGAIAARSALISRRVKFVQNVVAVAPSATRAIAVGAAIWSHGAWQSRADTFKANAASGPYIVFGGAAYASSSFELAGDAFLDNGATQGTNAPFDSEGGAVYIDHASGTIAASTFSGNVAGSASMGGYGGAIAVSGGTSAFTSLTVEGNRSTGEGGGLYLDGTVAMDGSAVSGNSVSTSESDGGGGGLAVWSQFTLANSTVSQNTTILGTTNTASGGGGIWSDGALSISGTTISGNAVQGIGHPVTDNGGAGIWSDNAVSMRNTTISGNLSSVDGGGIAQYRNAAVVLQNVTLYKNSAAGDGGNVYNPVVSSSVTIANSIVAGGSAAGTGADVDNDGAIGSAGYNLVGAGVAGRGAFAPLSTDIVGTSGAPVDPKLLALTNNGGPTQTEADIAGSPGRGAIPFTSGGCNGIVGDAADQRGFVRGAGGVCDIGAYEFGGVAGTAARAKPPSAMGIRPRPHRRHAAGSPPAPGHLPPF